MALVTNNPQQASDEARKIRNYLETKKDTEEGPFEEEPSALATWSIEGILTLEIVIEKILGGEIYDEKDAEKRNFRPSSVLSVFEESKQWMSEWHSILNESKNWNEEDQHAARAKFAEALKGRIVNDHLNKLSSRQPSMRTPKYDRVGLSKEYSEKLLDQEAAGEKGKQNE